VRHSPFAPPAPVTVDVIEKVILPMMDLTTYAVAGYDEPQTTRHYMLGSDAYIAWRVGKWLRENNKERPQSVVSGPGYRVVVDSARVYEVWEDTDVQDVTG
jgi:hypothetical protein